MKEILVLAAIMACIGLVASLLMINFMLNTIPATSSSTSGGDLFNYSVKSTISYLTVPALFLLVLSFLAFLIWLTKMRG
jgi:hypothetical protein